MWTLSEAKGLHVEFGFSSRWMMQKSAKGWEETLMRRVLIVGIIYMIKAFTWRFVLDAGKLRNFHNSVKNEATVDVHGCVITEPKVYLILLRYTDGVVYISAWASALLVRLNWAMRRPPSVGRVTVRLPRFFRVYPKLDINPIRDREPLEAIFRSDGIFFTRWFEGEA